MGTRVRKRRRRIPAVWQKRLDDGTYGVFVDGRKRSRGPLTRAQAVAACGGILCGMSPSRALEVARRGPTNSYRAYEFTVHFLGLGRIEFVRATSPQRAAVKVARAEPGLAVTLRIWDRRDTERRYRVWYGTARPLGIAAASE